MKTPVTEAAGTIPETCWFCRSIDLLIEGDEWSCRKCQAHSEGWPTRSREPDGPRPADTPQSTSSPRLYSDEEMLGFLVAWHREHGSAPTIKEWDEKRPAYSPHVKTYRIRFGSWTDAARAAGLEPNPAFFKSSTENEEGADDDRPLVELLREITASEPMFEEPPKAEDRSLEDVANPAEPDEIPMMPVEFYVRAMEWSKAEYSGTRSANDELRLRYIDGLITDVQEIDLAKNDTFEMYDWLCDRIERLLGLADPKASS